MVIHMANNDQHKWVFTLKRANEALIVSTRENWSLARIATESNLPKASIYRIAKGEASRVDLGTIGALVDFYNRYGLNIGPGDLIMKEVEVQSRPRQTTARQPSLPIET